jgi:hypothetical protein
MNERDGTIFGGAREHAGEIGGHNGIETIGDGGKGEGSALGELLCGALQI